MKGRRPTEKARVADRLRSAIVSGTYSAGARIPPRTELCKTLGSSSVTIQHAVNQLVEEGFVVASEGVGTYVAEFPPHTSCYALVFWSEPEIPWDKSLFVDTLAAVGRKLAEEGVNLQIFYGINQHTDYPDYQKLYRMVRAHRLAGMVFATIPFRQHAAKLFNQVDMPMVAMASNRWEHPFAHNVGFGHKPSEWREKAVAFLRQRGRRRVAVISYGWTPEAQEALRTDILASGMACPAHWLQVATPHRTGSAGGVVRLLCSLPQRERPDALLITEDNLVQDATAGLLASGLRIPDEMDVVAHANFPLLQTDSLSIRRLGYDCQSGLALALRLIDQIRAGERPPMPYLPVLWGEEVSDDAFAPAIPNAEWTE